MAFSLIENAFLEFKEILKNHESLMDADFETRLKKAIKVLHFGYLRGAVKECEKNLSKYPCDNLFARILYFYDKRQNLHSDKSRIIRCFEIALRSMLASKTADLFNTASDEWYTNPTQNPKIEKILKIVSKNKRLFKNTSDFANTFELFDIFTFGDLSDIIKILWDDIHEIFTSYKEYKGQELPRYGSANDKNHLINKIDIIRQARNHIYHNKPTNTKFIKETEILLLRMNYNLKDALKLSENSLIHLNFNYN